MIAAQHQSNQLILAFFIGRATHDQGFDGVLGGDIEQATDFGDGFLGRGVDHLYRLRWIGGCTDQHCFGHFDVGGVA